MGYITNNKGGVMNDLTIVGIISQGFAIGLKNLVSLIIAVVLWLVTIWIPYVNVGTTIGLLSIVIAMSKGSMISPFEIFDARYRKYIGEFFLVLAIVQLGTFIGFIFMIIPGIVISIAWSMALYLLIDKELNPMEAVKVSNQITYGEKWVIFFGLLLLGIILVVVAHILSFIGSLIADSVGTLLGIIGVIIVMPVILGAYAHIYGTLVQKIAQPAA